MRFVIMIGVVLCLTAVSNSQDSKRESKGPLFSKIWAVKINVLDLDEAIGFYTGLLEFEILSRQQHPKAVTLKNEDARIILVACDSLTTRDYDVGCRFNLNLYVEDLAAFVTRLHEAGVRALDDTMLTAGVGTYTRILDPSGNQLHILELGYDHEPVTKPTAYNIGARISDMATSRAFYERVLGFEVFSEKYYPPVIPYKVKGAQLVLHEGGEKSTRPAYPGGAQTILTLLTDDLEAALDKLKKAGFSPILPSSIVDESGTYNAVRDPDGNVVEVMEGL